MIAHNCPKEEFDEVWVSAGRPCPNGCGWIACSGDLEEFAVREAAAALALWGPWLRLSEAAAQSGVAFSTVAQAARTGRLPVLQLGRQKFVRLSAVQAACSATRGRPKPKSAKPLTPKSRKCKDCGKRMSGAYQASVIVAHDSRTDVVRCERCAGKRRQADESVRDSYFVV